MNGCVQWSAQAADDLARRYIDAPGMDRPAAMIDFTPPTPTWYYYHQDALGNVAALSNNDSNLAPKLSVHALRFGDVLRYRPPADRRYHNSFTKDWHAFCVRFKKKGKTKMQSNNSAYVLISILLATIGFRFQVQASVLNHSQDLLYPENLPYLEIYDSPPDITTVNVLGAMIQRYESHDSSITNVQSGHLLYLAAFDSSIVNIYGGNVTENAVRGFGTLNIYGGDSVFVSAYNSGTVNLFGGTIGLLYAFSDRPINVYGYGFEYIAPESTDPFIIGNGGTLNGYWHDGNGFSILLHNTDYDHLNLIAIPEPASLILLSYSILLVRQRIKTKH